MNDHWRKRYLDKEPELVEKIWTKYIKNRWFKVKQEGFDCEDSDEVDLFLIAYGFRVNVKWTIRKMSDEKWVPISTEVHKNGISYTWHSYFHKDFELWLKEKAKPIIKKWVAGDDI